jgi:hypothetical protein
MKVKLMKSLKAYLFLIILFFHSACAKENNEGFEYLIFGHFYGECIGEQCVEIFKLTSSELSEDSNDQYPSQDNFYDGNFSLISNEKFELVKDTPLEFPSEFWNEENTVIGQPDAGDWGGFYIEIKNEQGYDFWILDKMKPNVPVKYHSFIDLLNANIAQISD